MINPFLRCSKWSYFEALFLRSWGNVYMDANTRAPLNPSEVKGNQKVTFSHPCFLLPNRTCNPPYSVQPCFEGLSAPSPRVCAAWSTKMNHSCIFLTSDWFKNRRVNIIPTNGTREVRVHVSSVLKWNTRTTSHPLGWLLSQKVEGEGMWRKTGILFHSWWECKMVQSLWKSLAVPQKIKVELTYDPVIPLLSIYIPKRTESRLLKRYLYTHVHSSIIHNS